MKFHLPNFVFLFIILATLAACGQQESEMPPTDITIEITSPSFGEGEAIPAKFTCTGDNISPELVWSELPAGTKSFALIMDDPDAPVGTWVHWVLYNLPADARGLAESYTPESGVSAGKNSWGTTDYGGPCPPSGQHRYYFKLYALDIVLEENASMDKATLLKQIDGHVIGEGQLIGVYQKP